MLKIGGMIQVFCFHVKVGETEPTRVGDNSEDDMIKEQVSCDHQYYYSPFPLNASFVETFLA